MRVLFVARALDGVAGGVERMITTIMNGLVARGFEVDLLTWDAEHAESFYPMAHEIVWHRLAAGDPAVKAGPMLRLARARAVRSIARERRPAVVVAFQDGPFLAMLAYLAGSGIPLIAAERNAPTRFDHTRAGARRRLVTFAAFHLAAAVTVQCADYVAKYPRTLRRRIATIPNPVARASCVAQPSRPGPGGRWTLLSVGRLSYQKNYPVLIGAFSRLAAAFPDWDLRIVGEGEARPALERLVAQAGLDGRVVLPGLLRDPASAYVTAHLFCLPSRWEGFPNALAEAQAHGLPAVAFAGCAGVAAVIGDEETGLLAPGNGGEEALAATLERLMSDADARRSMGLAATARMLAFGPSRVLDAWARLVERCGERR